MGEFSTAGEKLLDRELATEVVVGVPHYMVGQHEAHRIAIDDPAVQSDIPENVELAVVSYVAPTAIAVKLPVMREPGGEWEPVGYARMAGMVLPHPAQALPGNFELSDKMKRALARLDR